MPTETDQKALKFIQKCLMHHGRAPTMTEIAAGMGIRSKGVAHRHVQNLINAGLLKRMPGRHRGLALTAKGEQNAKGPVLPLIGRIAAGQPIEAIAHHDEINVAEMLLGEGRFALRIQGDSMIGAGILDGDTVIVKSRSGAKNGQIVVALIDEMEATLKRFKRNDDKTITLIPENPSLFPVTYPASRIRIQGVVVGQLRTYDE